MRYQHMGDGYISFYDGGYSSLDPKRGNYVGFRMNADQLASTTSPNVANQLSETISRIKEGVKNVEVSLVSPEIAEGVPKQQFKEMQALMKLTGVKPSVHGPIIDPAGMVEKGYGGEYARQDVERRFMDTLEKAHELDPKGNVPVVFHASNSGTGPDYRPGDLSKGEERFKIHADTIVNRETGEIQKIKEKRIYYPEYVDKLDPNKSLDEQGKLLSVQKAIDSANQAEWDKKIREAALLQKEVEENIRRAVEIEGMGTDIPEFRSRAENYLSRGETFLQNAELSFRSIFDNAYEYGTKKQREELKELARKWEKDQQKLAGDLKNIKNPAEFYGLKNQLLSQRFSELRSKMEPTLVEKGGNITLSGDVPKVFVRAEDFVKDKTAKTFGNVAWQSYKKWKENSPVIAIENLYPGMAFAKADDLVDLVKKTRDNFVESAKKSGMSESEARKKAEKLIGVTWDVGHLNILKKQGFTDKDLVEQTKKVAPLVKHVHLTDNFGYGDSHLAMGMGNVPIKEILKELEKNGEFDKMRKVIEAGGLVDPNKGLKMSPFRETLGAFGPNIRGGYSPVYWNQAESVQGSYFAFPMAYLPEKHFSTYGSGFSTLPEELGGKMPGTGSRFSGTPNA